MAIKRGGQYQVSVTILPKVFLYRINGISSEPEVHLPFESCLTLLRVKEKEGNR